MKTFFLFIFLTTSIFAASNNSPIKSKDWNSSSLVIGTIQQSLLTLTEFQNLQGNCWKIMDGSSIAGTDLGALTQRTNLPDIINSGSFIRQAKIDRVIGSPQDETFLSHSHTNWFGNNAGGWSSGGLARNGGSSSTRSGDFESQLSGGDETRPKNIAVNFFIKVNKNCF